MKLTKTLIWILGLILLVGSVSANFISSTYLTISNETVEMNDSYWYCGLPFMPACNSTIGGSNEYYVFETTTFYTGKISKQQNDLIQTSSSVILGAMSGFVIGGGPLGAVLGAGGGYGYAQIINSIPPNPIDAYASCNLSSNDNVTKVYYVRTLTSYTTNSSNVTKPTNDIYMDSSTDLNASFDDIGLSLGESSFLNVKLYVLTNMTIAPMDSPNCRVVNDYKKYELSQEIINKLNKIQEDINNMYAIHSITFPIYKIITTIVNLIIELWYIAYWIFQMLAVTFIIGLIIYIFIFLYKLIKTLVDA